MAILKAVKYLIALFMCVSTSHAEEDWPMVRSDAARSAYTSNRVPAKLELSWKRIARHRPSPAWSGQPRLQYDHAYHPVLLDGMLFFGSSTDNKVVALDAATGATVWTFFTDGPVRVAPAVGEHGVYVGSDDGVFYCLDVKSGKLKWKLRAGPRDDRVMGNDRLISRWPVRGGPAIRDGVVYFAAGIWPTEGVYIYALDAHNGDVIWKNDTSGTMISNKPRAGSNVESGPAAQGHLAVGADVLVMPTGRAAPAVFDLKDGTLKHFHHALHVNKASGGTKAAVLGSLVVCGENYPAIPYRGHKTRVCTPDDGRNVAAAIGPVHADHPDMLITGVSDGLAGFAKQTVEQERKERDGTVTKYLSLSREPIWQCDTPFEVRDLVATQDRLVIGGDGQLAVLDIKTQAVLGQTKFEGKVQSLAVANGCVYAATDDGTLLCFSENGTGRVQKPSNPPTISSDPKFAAIAREILAKSGVTEGYCLDIGCGDGQLAYELATRSDLHIIGVDTDRRQVEAARERLDDLRLHGTRVTILHVDDLDKLPFTGRFAELVVSSQAMREGRSVTSGKTIHEMLCPYLGVACLGKPGSLRVTPRGPIEGAGNWTHFYADPHNSYCGTDTALHGPLELLWFRDTDYEMANRHSMSARRWSTKDTWSYRARTAFAWPTSTTAAPSGNTTSKG